MLQGRRGRRAAFDRQDVLKAIQNVGFTSFSLAGIARDLGVTAAALYRVVPSREAAVDLCLSEIFNTGAEQAEFANLEDLLKSSAMQLWETLSRFEGLSTLMLTFPYSPRGYLSNLAVFRQRCVDCGASEKVANLILSHVPVIIVSHHVVSEHQRRDALRAANNSRTLMDEWLGTSTEATVASRVNEEDGAESFSMNSAEVEAIVSSLFLGFDSAWQTVELWLRGVQNTPGMVG